MKKAIFALGILLSSAKAAYGLPLRADHVDFAAPIVADHSTLPGDIPFGSIIFDNSAGGFMGLAANGSWQPFTAQWGAGSGNLYFASGSVGIGTASPTAALQVEGNGGLPLKVSSTGVGGDSIILMTNNSDGHLYLYSGNYSANHGAGRSGNAFIDFRQTKDFLIGASTDEVFSSRADYLTIRGDNGNIGIGTVTPTVNLDVAGAIRPGDSTNVTTCGAGQANGEGSIRYNYSAHTMEYCNGTAWTAM